ncbi:MAG: recombination mediator RecR [Candidatus Omnitrophica bacterium]|nr:recombination mediator RecR [Candidatus Omnitrophota bacterium]
MSFPKIFNDLIESLSRFPGVGRRSAERMAFYILKIPPKEVEELARRIEEVQKFIKPCSLCNNFSTEEICSLCASPKREKDVICVVEEPKDILAIEKTGQYDGLYYCLLGSISPMEGIDGEDLNIHKLVKRVASGEIKEIIISTDPDNDGELTAQFLIQKLSVYKVKIYRLAIGIPLGTQIEYIDSATLGKALMDRKPVS